MNKEEYKKIIENNDETKYRLEIRSSIYALLGILISKNLCTREEYHKLKEKLKEEIINLDYKNKKKEDLEALKAINSFMNLFGGKNNE